MSYVNINDNELLHLIHEESEEAREALIKKYTGIVHSISKKYTGIALNLGIDMNDLIQEGLIGLTKAINTYDENKNVLFYTYVTVCIESNIRSALKSASRKKNESMNTSISLDKLLESEIVIDEFLKDELADPSIQVIDNDNTNAIKTELDKKLTDFERKVLDLKIDGFSNEEIGKKLDKNKRSIENTVARIKVKCKNILE